MHDASVTLSHDVTTLQHMVGELLATIATLRSDNEQLQARIDWLVRQHFGRKSERLHPDQRYARIVWHHTARRPWRRAVGSEFVRPSHAPPRSGGRGPLHHRPVTTGERCRSGCLPVQSPWQLLVPDRTTVEHLSFYPAE